ncbi:MAG: hypothetical protein Q4G14_13160 [Paracoccus sp. (in: a-proteobacteria)]|uniref:LEM-3-like GIY-YIG domain-containing protein n=1 Tax=Paracoccus sp. TaxID=267 RepID=UPI0026E04394|nr:hypothetical protein [Paracoccus sp. (in: a-proteobacteria)]MDO5614172.1 hypothetical protein [Paracoccus sp. (in: a-proteobacteria)]
MKNEDVTGFPAGVSEKLKFYVYRLIDPRNGETFYVGKGKGNRVFQHAAGLDADQIRTDDSEQENSDDAENLKISRIRDIRRVGLPVIHIIHRHGIEDARTAYEVEAAIIDALPGLSNIAAGHHSNDRGPMHAQEIIDKYALPKCEPRPGDRLVLININSMEHDNNQQLLDRVRYAWKIAQWRAEQADFVLAVIHGIVRGVFVPKQWLPATPEHFPPPRFTPPATHRLGFKGELAPDDIWQHYVGKRGKWLPDDMRHGQNPVRYYNL